VNAGCAGCHSTAVGNAASAANGGCEGCGALAFTFARQRRIQVDGDAILSADARQQIAALLRRIARPTPAR
jgi:hypothetical protein